VIRDIKRYLIGFIARREYTTWQLREKALKKGYNLSDITSVIRELEADGLVNDSRYAELFVDTYGNSHGNTWLRVKLTHLHIPNAIIESVLEGREETLPAELVRMLERKYHIDNWRCIDAELKVKIAHYLARRGYRNPFALLDKLGNDNDD